MTWHFVGTETRNCILGMQAGTVKADWLFGNRRTDLYMPVAMAKLMPPPSTADPSACIIHMYNHCARVTVLVGGWEELVGTA